MVVIDTNVLLNDIDILKEYNNIIIPICVLEEIDKLKNDEKIGYKARLANKEIEKYKNSIKFDTKDFYDCIPVYWDENKNDNKIIGCAYEHNADVISNDVNVRIKAESLDLNAFAYKSRKYIYKGYTIFKFSTKQINEFFNDICDYNLYTNQYIQIINTDLSNKDLGYTAEYRFDGEKLVPLKLPPSKVVKGWNVQQRFALDLLYNRDIPIKVILGKPGSGKTALSVKVGCHFLDKEFYSKITFLRTPIAADNTDIGFLPGDKDSKIQDYMKSMLQYVSKDNNQFYLENLLREDRIEMDVVTYLKGVDFPDRFIIFDEVEDLNVKLLKLVGTRVSKNANIVLAGDIKQAESRFKSNNGIELFINKAKGNSLVGIIFLDVDVRSDASKVFVDLLD